jgi:hypothetical protein
MDNPQQLIEAYIATFNETDSGRRTELVAALYADDSTYTDPHVDLRGPAQISQFIEQTQQQFPGYLFRLRGAIDAHHDQARFQWAAGPADDPDRFVGFDVVVADNGRISNVYGFTDVAPEA